MSIQIKDKNGLLLTSNLLDGRNNIRDFRLAAEHEIAAAELRPYMENARKMILDELTLVGAIVLHQRDKTLLAEVQRKERAAQSEEQAIKMRKAAWNKIMPLTTRGAFDEFCQSVGIGEVVAFGVSDNGVCKQWSDNHDWRVATKRAPHLQAGLRAGAGVVVVSVPTSAADVFAKRFSIPKCFSWDAAGMRNFAMAIPGGAGIGSNAGLQCRVSTADSTRYSFAPVDGLKIVTAPKQVAIDDQGYLPACPAVLVATIKAAANADARALDEVLTC
jgi:hypothetical protein